MHCWPCFIPWWYKTHYASHYLSVRMPGNEMIHIQEGYLRWHFNISKQQHVIFTLKSCSKTKAFDPRSSVPHFNGNIRAVCLTLAFDGDPFALIQMHPTLLWFSAGAKLSIKIRRRLDPQPFWWNTHLIKPTVLPSQKVQEKIPQNCVCQDDGALLQCNSDILIIF